MPDSYHVAPVITYNRPGQGVWLGTRQWYYGVEGVNITALNIYLYGNYNHYEGDTWEEQGCLSDAISYH